jgi:hypothetical protein
MLLNHYTAYLEKIMQGRIGSLTSTTGVTYTYGSLNAQAGNVLLPLLLHQNETIVVGSDNTAETGDSYCLKKQITSGINLGLAKSVVDNDDGSHSSIVIANCTNTSSEPITIGEIGITKFMAPSTKNEYFVFDRTPLGTPLTIQPGEVGRIVYTITMA